MGTGQLIADPQLGFVRAVFWGDSVPNCQEGIFAATLVLKLGCEMAPIGVAPPLQMAILHSSPEHKGQLRARNLSDEELYEHGEVADEAMKYFSEFRSGVSGRISPENSPPVDPNAQL